MTSERELSDYFEKARLGADERGAELAKALEGAPAAAIRKYLEDSGVKFAETRMFRGEKGSTVWAVGSHASGTLTGKAVNMEFDPDAIHFARLLATVMNISRLPEDRDVGLPEGFRNPDGSVNIDVLR
ncbi:hypothetical protein D3C71_1525090 [compost metagenome]